MIERLFSFTIEITLAVSLLILVLMGLGRIIAGRYSARCQYLLWLILALRLAVPLNLNLPVSFVHIVAPYRFTVERIPAPLSFVDTIMQRSVSLFPFSFIQTISMVQLLTVVWLIGGCGYFLYHIMQYSIFKNNIMRWSKSVSPEVLEQFYHVKYEMGIYRPLQIRASSAIKTPMITGFLHPCILLPEYPMEKVDREMVLRHELVHFRRNDMYFKLLLLIVGAMHWFNPLVHILIHQAGKAIETSCDSEVVAKRDFSFIRRYAQAIMEVAKLSQHQEKFCRATILAAYSESSKEILKQRFINLFHENKKSGKGFLFLITGLSILGSTLIWFRGNDHNLEWAKTVRPHDIAEVEVITADGTVSGTVSSTNGAKLAIVRWLNQIQVEPAILKKTDRLEKITYIITQNDGEVYEVSRLDNRSVKLNGKEYRFPAAAFIGNLIA